MELDIDFTAPRSKRPFYACLFLILVMLLFTLQITEILREFTCDYIEKLLVFYYDIIGLTEDKMESMSDFWGFTIIDWWLFSYIIFSDNKYFALLQFIAIKPKGMVPQMLKIIIQDSRPAWTCHNVDIDYCRTSFGVPATHVFEATAGWLSFLYFTFVHNGYFNRYRNKIWVQIIRYIGIAVCIFWIWFVHQSRMVLGAHYIYQDIYGFLGGAAYFYAMYYWFYPWAMDPAREFKWTQIWKFQIPLLLVFNFFLLSVTYLAIWGLEIDPVIVENLYDDCFYSKGYTYYRMVIFDVYFGYAANSSLLLLALLPLKHTLRQGHFWLWSLVGIPIFGVCTYYILQFKVMTWISWDSMSSYWLSYYCQNLYIAFFGLVEFVYLALAIKFFAKKSSVEAAEPTSEDRKEI